MNKQDFRKMVVRTRKYYFQAPNKQAALDRIRATQDERVQIVAGFVNPKKFSVITARRNAFKYFHPKNRLAQDRLQGWGKFYKVF